MHKNLIVKVLNSMITIKFRQGLIMLLIASNILCLYRSIELFSYERMVAFLTAGENYLTNPKQMGIVFLSTCIGNLIYISATLMNSIINGESTDKSKRWN